MAILPKIPINMKSLAKAGKTFIGQADSETLINILVDKTVPLHMIESCRLQLVPEPQSRV